MDGFETYIIAAVRSKNVPVQVVADREKADYQLSGNAESEKPGWARTIFLGQSKSIAAEPRQRAVFLLLCADEAR